MAIGASGGAAESFPGKPLQRSPASLPVARIYSRDKHGRFASSSAGGATARGNRLTGKAGKQGRRGGNLDAGDTGKLSSVPKGTVAGSRGAQDRSRADRKGVSLKQSKNMGAAERSANTKLKKKSGSALTKVNFRTAARKTAAAA
jgi:hypothetical protein